jgi:hypothetical protein
MKKINYVQMKTILQVLFSPERAFNELKQESKFPAMALTILLLLIAVYLILMVPIMSKITAIMMSSMPLPEAQLDRALEITHKLRYLQVIGGIFTTAIILILYALLLYVITLIAKPALTYIKSFILVVYSYFALLIGELINTGLLYIKGLDQITNPFEIALTGVNLFTTIEKTGAAVYTFLTLINPFQIWFVILLSIGVKVFAEIKYAKALIICIIFWLITIIYPIAAVMLSETVLKNAEIM